MVRAVVTGAGGFIGHHLVRYLKDQGYWVRGVDVKYPEYGETVADEFKLLDLRRETAADLACVGVDHVYNLAATMGGIGFITGNRVEIVQDNTRINLNMLAGARRQSAGRFFFSSSACAYNTAFQHEDNALPLSEADAWPAMPEEGYGLEKLYAEKACEYYQAEGLLETRVARFHNVYGPLGTYEGGREKAPAAICRKVAKATDALEIWGDGKQTRSFMYVDDCVEGIHRIMASDHAAPLNLGSDELVTIDGLADIVMSYAGKDLDVVHVEGPQGVRGRNSDNTRAQRVLGWAPSIPLKTGIAATYDWIAAR